MPYITFVVDAGLMAEIEKAVRTIGETDRSKFIRATLRERVKLVNAASAGRSIGSIPRVKRTRAGIVEGG